MLGILMYAHALAQFAGRKSHFASSPDGLDRRHHRRNRRDPRRHVLLDVVARAPDRAGRHLCLELELGALRRAIRGTYGRNHRSVAARRRRGDRCRGAKSPEEGRALLAERVRHSPQMTSLMVIGPDGNLRFASAQPSRRAVNLAGTRYFTWARESNGLHFSVGDPVMPSVHGKHVIFVSRRLSRPDGSFGGVIVASLNPDYVMQFFYTLNVGQKGIIALESTDGSLLVRRPYLEDFVGRNFSSSVLFK